MLVRRWNPGVVIEKKSDRGFAAKSRREIKIIHQDKIKKCEARKLPKWLVEYKYKLQSDESPITTNAAGLGSRSKTTRTQNDARRKPTKGQVPHLGQYMCIWVHDDRVCGEGA